jgi:hypothetical protein
VVVALGQKNFVEFEIPRESTHSVKYLGDTPRIQYRSISDIGFTRVAIFCR